MERKHLKLQLRYSISIPREDFDNVSSSDLLPISSTTLTEAVGAHVKQSGACELLTGRSTAFSAEVCTIDVSLTASVAFIYVSFSVFFLLPMILMLVMYSHIFAHVTSGRHSKPLMASSEQRRIDSRRRINTKRQLIRMLGVVLSP